MKECQKFAPSLKNLIYHGTERQLARTRFDLIITTYGLVRREVEKFKKINWDLIIIDEAQNIKNADSKQTKAVKALKSNAFMAVFLLKSNWVRIQSVERQVIPLVKPIN